MLNQFFKISDVLLQFEIVVTQEQHVSKIVDYLTPVNTSLFTVLKPNVILS